MNKHDIGIKYFKDNYASEVVAYSIGILNNTTTIGNCPIMHKMLDVFLKHEITSREIFHICSKLRSSAIKFVMKNGFLSEEVFDEINYIFDENFAGLISIYDSKISSLKETLQENSSILNQYKHAVDEGTIVSKTDKHGFITYINHEFCKISGYTEEELIGRPHNAVRHSDMPKELFKEMWQDLKRFKSWKGVIKNRAKDGSAYYVKALIKPILDSNDEVQEYIAIRQDITEVFELQEEIVRTQKEILEKLGELVEGRSEETGFHVQRVAKYSKLLAIKYGLNEEEANLIQMASTMHDVGKIAIADKILLKPGKLSEDEFNEMKKHSVYGYEIFKSSKRELLKAAAMISYHHHEKYDGTGYPQGLKGQNIHIYGRIVALADVFDALGSDRIYKKSWELNKILELLKEESGKHFDPELIEIFFNNLHEFLYIKDKFNDGKNK